MNTFYITIACVRHDGDHTAVPIRRTHKKIILTKMFSMHMGVKE